MSDASPVRLVVASRGKVLLGVGMVGFLLFVELPFRQNIHM